ncbi:hypothetical protein [Pedomonas sp. V897]|uniref:hypothetical protein n=1 Tax=Pedomonas sp. V897 TaxID=3446482 RepID=UPI003EE22B86
MAAPQDRTALLAALIRCDTPLAPIRDALAALPLEATPAATLTRADIAAVLDRYEQGALTAGEVALWASLVECREDIQFEPRHEPVIADALYDLANQEALPLPDILEDVRFLLGV